MSHSQDTSDCKDHLGFLKSCPQLVSSMLVSVVIFVNISAVAQIKFFFLLLFILFVTTVTYRRIYTDYNQQGNVNGFDTDCMNLKWFKNVIKSCW